MSNAPRTSSKPSAIGCAFAAALALLPAAIGWLWRGPISAEEWPFALFYGLLIAMPFGYLALDGARDWRPWTVSVLLSALCWGLLLKLGGPGLGAVLIALGIPLLVTVAAWSANQHRHS